MPIRTNRGRAAVYRRLWGWPLRSPRHLVATGIGVVVLAIAIAVAINHGVHHNKPGVSATASSSSAGATTSAGLSDGTSASSGGSTTTTPEQTRLTGVPSPANAPTPPAALGVINLWGRAWVNHPVGMTDQQWLNQLAPYTTPEFLPQMNTVDVTNIAATAVTGQPVVVNSYTGSVEATLATNAGSLDITVILTPQGWQVSTYNQAS
ncbi:MAG TPA: hypothetical protein VHW44_22880 [Pseudonocardiaceae bacterium]|jgi:hypothetical protein|nr:hypothetical protein [Pseudonocardiaceae bacterium]